jgi:pSer/pThr/pTyr-binding forkhead associated (FHA) protein
MAIVLVVQSGKHRGRKIKFPEDGKLLIGRDPECHLRLASTDVSRKHCLLTLGPAGVAVKDLGSRNGTFVDDFLVSPSGILKPGSVLRVGNMEFKLLGKRRPAGKSDSVDEEPMSDDEIAVWLTNEGETDQPNLEDSTIVPGKKPPAAEESEPSEKEKLTDYSRHPHAEAAAEIIVKHWQSKG